jgi:glucoamylase
MPNESYAPGAPGIKAKWTSSSKSGIGKALNATSQVAFTISHGIINEVYYPREDIACIRDMGLIIADGDNFFSEEKRDTDHSIKMLDAGIPAYQVTNTCTHKKYQVIKEIVTDPIRNTLLQKINFRPAKKLSSALHAYVLLAPHLADEGGHNSGWTGEYKGVSMLFAQNGDLCLALACSSKFIKRSVGYVGHSDGWRDIDQHKKMEWEYTKAENGNIALMAELDVSGNDEMVLAVGFGRNANEAAIHAWGSILEGFESAKKSYIKGWENWLKALNNLNGKNFKISSAVLRMHEAKSFPGGVVASLSIPWGETKGDTNKGGYHVVWPRDLVESAGGFMALKAEEDTLRILNYLISTQKADGSWPQNMWLEGSSHWKGMQMDQTALPIILTCQCHQSKYLDKTRMQRYWPVIKKALSYLIINGPYTEEDRWEEEKGYSPFTLACEIAGLLAGADLADANDEQQLAQYCRETADYWNDQIETWTYVTGTSLAKKYGVDGYYIRINPFHEIPANDLGDRTIDLKNHHNGEGKTKLTELVSVDALSLVRFGLRSPDDPKIVNTVKVIDAMLKVNTPNGACWHRYNNDGYGEDEKGDPYDGAGIGRAWPLLTGERAHFEIANNNLEEAKTLLKAMDAFANNGLLSEQIWDTEDMPEKELYFGEHSGSAMPLTWAHAEYIKLCASIKAKKIFDMPPQTQDRYLKRKTKSDFQIWRFNKVLKNLEAGKSLRIEVMAKATVIWTDDAWQTTRSTGATDTGIGIFIVDIKPVKEQASKIEFTFYWENTGNWESKNYAVSINKP